VVRDAVSGQPVPGAILYVGHHILDADATGFYRIPELSDDLQVTVKSAGFLKATLSLAEGIPFSSGDGAVTPCAQAPPAANPQAGAGCLDLHLTPFQVRGLYVPFGLLSKPDKVRDLLDLIELTELNALVVDVKGDRGYLAYTSQIPLAVELGVSVNREDWLGVNELLAEARARDIYTIARLVLFKDNPAKRFGTTTSPSPRRWRLLASTKCSLITCASRRMETLEPSPTLRRIPWRRGPRLSVSSHAG
jgi:hypothetical protein